MYRKIHRTLAVLYCLLTCAVVVQGSPTAAELLKIKWVNVPAKPPLGVKHGTFYSECMDTTVGYNIYLPPSYDTDSAQRFPVVYFLHGSAGNESRSIRLATYLHKAIKAGQVAPMLMVFANGGRNSAYIDAIDGTVLPETMIVKELIPHIDANYLTIGRRSGRAIQGFSMGGGGSLRIAAKFPDLFSSVVVYDAGGVREFDHIPTAEESRDVEKTRRKLPARMAIMGEDLAYWQETGSWYLLEKNRDRIVDRLPIRIVIGTEDFSLEGAKVVRDRLAELKIAYEFELVQGPEHNIYKLYDHAGLEGLLFHARHFGDSAAD
ncbi:MAG: alpha/beta hydrolase-fold protein [Verrucomicrobia bacterium]|nr:alpha/beta hydrolase-fold protein [Verrucomicrobiota bacterium]